MDELVHSGKGEIAKKLFAGLKKTGGSRLKD